MSRILFTAIAVTALLVSGAVSPVAAAQGDSQVDECQNADVAGEAGGPPGFVADLVPDFLSDLLGSLPVPDPVKAAFGATTCQSG